MQRANYDHVFVEIEKPKFLPAEYIEIFHLRKSFKLGIYFALADTKALIHKN